MCKYDEDVLANCKFCREFYEAEECYMGFCMNLLEYVKEEDYTEDCDVFTVRHDKIYEYNEWIRSLK
jgi:hypothetical protein